MRVPVVYVELEPGQLMCSDVSSVVGIYPQLYSPGVLGNNLGAWGIDVFACRRLEDQSTGLEEVVKNMSC